MLDQKIEAALNKQINHEISAGHSYLAMAAYFETLSLAGFARWMQTQQHEEMDHAMRLFRYVADRGGRVVLDALAKPHSDFSSVLQVFERALALEQLNTKAIHDLFALAVQAKDYPTQSHLKWFIDEQVEEEKIMQDVISRLSIAGEDKAALLILDQEMAQRATPTAA